METFANVNNCHHKLDLYVDVVTCSIWGQNIFNSVTFKPSLVPLYLIVRRQINIKNVLVMGTCEKKKVSFENKTNYLFQGHGYWERCEMSIINMDIFKHYLYNIYLS